MSRESCKKKLEMFIFFLSPFSSTLPFLALSFAYAPRRRAAESSSVEQQQQRKQPKSAPAQPSGREEAFFSFFTTTNHAAAARSIANCNAASEERRCSDLDARPREAGGRQRRY